MRVAVQEDMSKLSEQEHILLLLQQKYHSMSEKDGCEFLNSIASRADRMPVEMVTEEFLK